MATTIYFEETIEDQGGKTSMALEIGTSSFYQQPSLYIKADDNIVIMDIETAKKFVDSVISAGEYYGLVD